MPTKPKTSSNAMFYTYGTSGPDQAVTAQCLDAIEPIHIRTDAARGRVNVRDPLTRADYSAYRPAESTPKKPHEKIALSDDFYRHNGIVHNVVDLMADFGAQGIQIYHPDPDTEKILRHWFRKIGGRERTERFLNLFYRQGNVVVKRAFADLNLGDIQEMQHGVAYRRSDDPADMDFERHPKYYKNRIPMRYTFLNPMAVEITGGELAAFVGSPRYSLRIPQMIVNAVKNPRTPEEKELVAKLPDWVIKPIKAGKKTIPLAPEKIAAYHYKKDDWQQWADPMLYSIIHDLRLYEKMKLADAAALDGAISHIRLWRLGDLKEKVQPGPKAFQKLNEVLQQAAQGGSMDLIWDATLDLIETSTEVHKFLGGQKYEPVLRAIYAGLGIPQGLTGGGSSQGMTDNVLSLKTLIERLQYGRDVVTEFWERELHILQEAFDDAEQGRIHFETLTLSDEASEKMLWLHLWDRDIVSTEMIREKFDTLPEVEERRISRERKDRDADRSAPKASPFHTAQTLFEKEKIALSQGTVSPKEVGLKVGDESLLDYQERSKEEDRKLQKKQMNDQKKLNEQKAQQDSEFREAENKIKLKYKEQEMKIGLQQKKKGQSGQGRPKMSKDSKPRDQRTPKPRTSAFRIRAWAKQAQSDISKIIVPDFLKKVGKKNVRSLTIAELDHIEKVRAEVLWRLTPLAKVTPQSIADLGTLSVDAGDALIDEAKVLIAEAGIDDTVENRRDAIASAYSSLKGEYDGEDDSDGGHGDSGD